MTDSTQRLLADLVAFDTTSRNSNLPLVDYVRQELARHGVASRLVHDESGTKANLWATIGPAGVPGVVLSGHTDTVPVDGQRWTSDPFRLRAEGGRLYARGACDMKGFCAAVLALVPELAAAKLTRPVHLAFSYDEEVGCVGVERLLQVLRQEGVRPAFCIVGEPTSMQVVVGHKAKRSMRVTVTGRTVHSALAPSGVNAVDYGALVVLRMREIAARLAAHGGRDPLYDVPHTTAHTGVFRGGTALNIVPDRAVVDCEFRVLPSEDADALVAELRAYAADLTAEMRVRAPEAGIEVEVFAGFPGLETAPQAEVAVLAKQFSGRDGHGKVAFGTEAGRFDEMLGVPTVVCGPGSIEQAHKADEFVAAAQLAECERFLGRLAAWAGA